MEFEFLDPGVLSDGGLDVVVEKTEPADPGRGYVPAYHFALAVHGSKEKVGEIRLRVGNVPSLEISGHVGYGVDEAHRGHGYAARACRLIAPVALAHGLDRLIITCDPANVASRKTCERLGAALVGEFDVPPDHPMFKEGRRRVLRYVWTLAAGPT
jgi:predicted acetyltransferase